MGIWSMEMDRKLIKVVRAKRNVKHAVHQVGKLLPAVMGAAKRLGMNSARRRSSLAAKRDRGWIRRKTRSKSVKRQSVCRAEVKRTSDRTCKSNRIFSGTPLLAITIAEASLMAYSRAPRSLQPSVYRSR